MCDGQAQKIKRYLTYCVSNFSGQGVMHIVDAVTAWMASPSIQMQCLATASANYDLKLSIRMLKGTFNTIIYSNRELWSLNFIV